MKNFIRIFALTFTLGMIGFGPSYAMDKTEVESIIKEYLNNNPEVILDSLEAYREAQRREFQAATEARIKNGMDQLVSGLAPSIGNPKGDVTVIEFFDYNCGYCKRAVPDIQELVKNDKNVHVIFKEMPILSPNSVVAAKWALAADKQDKYFEYHAALMKHRGNITLSVLKDIAKDLSIDIEKLEKDANSEDLADALSKEQDLARELGVQGTPAFIINGTFLPGYLGPDGLKDAVENARKNIKGS